MIQRVIRLLVPALLASSFLVWNAGTCWACSCPAQTPKQVLRDADAAFVGRAVSERILTGTTTIQVFEVGSVYRGRLGPTVEVIMQVGAEGGSDCGILYSRGQRVAMALDRLPEGTYTTTLCSRLSIEEIEEAGGPPVPPDPAVSAAPRPPAAAPPTPLIPDGAVIPLGAAGALALIAAAVWIENVRARRRGSGQSPSLPGGPAAGPDAAEPSNARGG